MPSVGYRVKINLYRDSVALMQLATALLARPGILQATALMATPANLELAAGSGLLAEAPTCSFDDLLIAIAGIDQSSVDSALEWATAELAQPAKRMIAASGVQVAPPTSLAAALEAHPHANLAFIAVPGPYATAESLKALKAGLHVVLFSSGVSLEDEAFLKQEAEQRGLLLLGAECGTAIIGGVPLGFANVVRRGEIGLVAASGTGLQEVTCLIDRWGGGISHAIGTGGRDLAEQVGGLAMLAGLRLLRDDPTTSVIVLISKPPAPTVAARLIAAARETGKPVVIAFLGADPTLAQAAGLIGATTLEQAARAALAASNHTVPVLPAMPAPTPIAAGRRFVRGLFAGGTLCSEATQILQATLGDVLHPDDESMPEFHTCLDLGDERFTQGRPHPMIDARLRAEYLQATVADSRTAVVLFDVVLGHGASDDPVGPLLAAIGPITTDGPRIVAYVCGTNADPQQRDRQVARLELAGVIVGATNAQSAQIAASLVRPQ